MDVRIRTPWDLIVDDMINGRDVKPASGGSEQDSIWVGLEPATVTHRSQLRHTGGRVKNTERRPVGARCERGKGHTPIEVFQTLPLFKLRMQWERRKAKQF